mmetsp:Transcript_612/g.1186  ORF Transcript_612/g.1186 Transcript_612/m.1186 type:complete len:294 (+) Transcript_612:363-1244(+)
MVRAGLPYKSSRPLKSVGLASLPAWLPALCLSRLLLRMPRRALATKVAPKVPAVAAMALRTWFGMEGRRRETLGSFGSWGSFRLKRFFLSCVCFLGPPNNLGKAKRNVRVVFGAAAAGARPSTVKAGLVTLGAAGGAAGFATSCTAAAAGAGFSTFLGAGGAGGAALGATFSCFTGAGGVEGFAAGFVGAGFVGAAAVTFFPALTIFFSTFGAALGVATAFAAAGAAGALAASFFPLGIMRSKPPMLWPVRLLYFSAHAVALLCWPSRSSAAASRSYVCRSHRTPAFSARRSQ